MARLRMTREDIAETKSPLFKIRKFKIYLQKLKRRYLLMHSGKKNGSK